MLPSPLELPVKQTDDSPCKRHPVKSSFLVRTMAASAAALPIWPAHAAVLTDPEGSGVIVGAVNWLQGTLLGTVATVAAVIAVAVVGFMMLTGRVNWRFAATVIVGCFILFGAGAIVAGIQSAAAVS